MGRREGRGGRNILLHAPGGVTGKERGNMQQRFILLVEDNPDDVELTLRALRVHNVQNEVAFVIDVAVALEYLFTSGY